MVANAKYSQAERKQEDSCNGCRRRRKNDGPRPRSDPAFSRNRRSQSFTRLGNFCACFQLDRTGSPIVLVL